MHYTYIKEAYPLLGVQQTQGLGIWYLEVWVSNLDLDLIWIWVWIWRVRFGFSLDLEDWIWIRVWIWNLWFGFGLDLVSNNPSPNEFSKIQCHQQRPTLLGVQYNQKKILGFGTKSRPKPKGFDYKSQIFFLVVSHP